MLRVEGLTIRADSNEGILGGDGNVLPSFSNGYMPLLVKPHGQNQRKTQ